MIRLLKIEQRFVAMLMERSGEERLTMGCSISWRRPLAPVQAGPRDAPPATDDVHRTGHRHAVERPAPFGLAPGEAT